MTSSRGCGLFTGDMCVKLGSTSCKQQLEPVSFVGKDEQTPPQHEVPMEGCSIALARLHRW